jgi:hypothetical protein
LIVGKNHFSVAPVLTGMLALALSPAFGFAEDGAGASPSAVMAAPVCSMEACVLPQDGSGPLPADNGTQAAPVPVSVGDEIEYRISVRAPGEGQGPPPRYDMLFVLDWSASMDAGYASPRENPVPARVLAKDALLAVSRKVLEEYPDSRVAVMGLNSSGSNTGDPMYTNLQVDTDFVAEDRYEEVIAHAFEGGGYPPNVGQDDNATYIRAATEKLRGSTSTAYGGFGMPGDQHVLPRADRSRTPIVIHITDFEIDDPPDYRSSFGGYWRMSYAQPPSMTNSLNARLVEYRNAYPDGIYIAVRTDHYDHYENHPQFRGAHYNQLMANTISLSPNWTWMWIDMSDYTKQAENLAGLIHGAAPIRKVQVTVTDLLPAGLSFVSSDPGAVVTDRDGRAEVVLSAEMAEGSTEVFTLRARVEEYGVFENVATARAEGGTSADTNHTWHRAKDPTPPTLHIRQILVEGGRGAVPLPRTGYWKIESGGAVYPVSAQGGAGSEGGLSAGAGGYARVLLPLADDDMTATVHCIVPQYYVYAGHVRTTADTPHDPASRQPDLPDVDFSVEREQWVTLYLRPVTDNPGRFCWGSRRNVFG